MKQIIQMMNRICKISGRVFISEYTNMLDLGYLTEEEFNAIYDTLLEQDCKKETANAFVRRLTDDESKRFRTHLWQVFRTYQKNVNPEIMFKALKETEKKYSGGSLQERAEEMMKYFKV